MIEAANPELIADAKRYAALSAIYDPIEALPEAVRDDPVQASLVASALALASDTNPDEGSGWLLRSAERRYLLAGLRKDARLDEALAERRRGRLDPATADLLDALDGRGTFAPNRLAETIADPDVAPATIERIVTALDRVDPDAPGAGALTGARIRLAELADAARRAAVVGRGFFGRDDELATLAAWLAVPVHHPPAQAALITGSPGIGKSALLDAMTTVAINDQNALVVRLDFDRAGLDVLDLRGLTMEVSRQLADRIGAGAEDLLAVRLAAARIDGGSAKYEGSARALVPVELVAAIGNAVRATGRPVFLILDTLEVLRARGERHVAQLFDWIDRLVEGGVVPLSVTAAGRGDVFDACPERRGPSMALDGLDRDAAAQLLERLAVPVAARAAVLDLADGCPLVIRLAARIVNEHGALPRSRRKLTGEVTAGFLYRFLLSRIVDPDLRRLAHPGLIARRLSADFLRDVLAPQLGLKTLGDARAQALFDALAAEHWLVKRDPTDPLFVRHRGDMRALLLPLLYRDRPGQCARIDAAAARWFGQRGDATSQADAAYHGLQLMRTRPRPPMLDAAVAQLLDPAAVAELPPAAQAVVERVCGGRSAFFRGEAAHAGPDDDEAVAIVGRLVEAGDWQEGRYVVTQIEQGGLDPRGVVADAVRTYYWRAGLWDSAWHLLADRDRSGATDDDLTDRPPQLALARLEMRAEFDAQLADEKLTAITNVAKAPSGLSRSGALGFLMAARWGRDEGNWDKEGDPVAAALTLSRGERGHAAEFAFGRARDRLRARGLTGDLDDPQLLATMTPYAVFAAALALQPDRVGIDASARDIEARLAAGGALIADGPASPGSASPMAGIADLGLFAEWAGVAAMGSADPDLRRIARSAERWRRTVAGDWAYGSAPPGWRPATPLDRTLYRRLSRLLKAKRPRHAAYAELALWAADGDGERLWTTLDRRFATTLAAAARIDDPRARAVLLRRRIPTAFVPGAAILTGDLKGEG